MVDMLPPATDMNMPFQLMDMLSLAMDSLTRTSYGGYAHHGHGYGYSPPGYRYGYASTKLSMVDLLLLAMDNGYAPSVYSHGYILPTTQHRSTSFQIFSSGI